MKFVMTQAVCPEGMQLLDGIADVYVADNQDPNNYLDEMKDADALIVRIAKCDANAIENSPKLKVIGRTGVGYDSVDVKKATELGIPVVITPGANNRSVAEHAVAMIFALSKNLIEAQNEMCKGNWEIRGAKKAFELEGKTVGILGLGAIGRETAKICKGCGMSIAAYDPFMTKEQVEGYGAKYYEDYVELLKDSDVVSIHVPLTDQTRNMISKKELSVMKPTALIINCSRGGIINEADLVEALNNGVIAGAGTDVFCSEPPKTDDPLLNCRNLIVSPHSAAQTTEGRKLSEHLCERGIEHTVCVATEYGEIVLQENAFAHVHMGRMDSEGMRSFFAEQKCKLIVDATHPYAAIVTENIKQAVYAFNEAYAVTDNQADSSISENIEYVRLKRDTDISADYDNIRYFEDNEACAKALNNTDGNILLTTGSKELSVYCKTSDVRERLYVQQLPGSEQYAL